jgi:hypothetical protein
VTTVEESTRISAINGCQLTVETTKLTKSASGEKTLKFVLYVDLPDLTTPSSVVSKEFSACKPKNGAVLKLISPVQPGRKIRVSRQETVGGDSSAGASAATEITRNDLSLFFSNPVAAKKAAAALDSAIKACGGQEWPDEDDLP